jgi:ABC-type cobalt transport system substrate-binding protein
MSEAKIRIVSTSPAEAEELINELLQDYAPIVWNIFSGPSGTVVTCVLLSERELRKAQLMAANMVPGRPPGR